MTDRAASPPGLAATLPRAALLFLIGAIATIAGAWGFQLIAGLPPCPLCLQQRWAYYAAIPLAAAALLLARRGTATGVARAALGAAGLAMLAGAGLGVYHAGIEWSWWAGPSGCSGAGFEAGALPDLGAAQVVRCDEAAWRLFGLSLAGWNVLVSLALAALAFIGMRAGAPRASYGSSSVSQ